MIRHTENSRNVQPESDKSQRCTICDATCTCTPENSEICSRCYGTRCVGSVRLCGYFAHGAQLIVVVLLHANCRPVNCRSNTSGSLLQMGGVYRPIADLMYCHIVSLLQVHQCLAVPHPPCDISDSCNAGFGSSSDRSADEFRRNYYQELLPREISKSGPVQEN